MYELLSARRRPLLDKRLTKRHIVLALVFAFVWVVLGSSAGSLRAQQALDPEKLLTCVDNVRNPQGDYALRVKVTSHSPSKEPKTAEYEVLVKGRDKTLIKTLYPPLDRGTSMLMLGYDLWVHMPTIRQPLRISLQQRLLGEVAYGDIARANFSGDYTPSLLDKEPDSATGLLRMELKAKNDQVTYHKVILWIVPENCRPVRAEFYAPSGKLLKTCSYEGYQEVEGLLRPCRLVMEDPLKEGSFSVLEYSSIRSEELPEKFFSKHYMENLRY